MASDVPADRKGQDRGTVLLTGIHGFTGQYLAARLRQAGYQVAGTTTDGRGEPGCYQLDLRDGDQVRRLVRELRPDAVIHLAAVAFVGHGSPADFYNVNVIGTRNLLAALADSGHTPDKVILASSANIYGNGQSGALTEQTPPAPANDYAVSKLAMEHMAWLWREQLPLIICRPFNYTGVGQEPRYLVPKIVDHFRRREPVIELGNLDVVRDFSDVRAVAEAYCALLEVEDSGLVVNIGSGQGQSLKGIVDTCSELTGHELEVQVNPAFQRANEVRTLVADISRLQRLVPQWQPIPFSQTLAWMLGQK